MDRSSFGRASNVSRELHCFASVLGLETAHNLGNVFDLTNQKNLRAFIDIIKKFTTTKELRALARKIGQHAALVHSETQLHKTLLCPNWRLFPEQYDIPANSQVFGYYLNVAKFAGVLFPSVRATDKKCIAIYPQNFSDTDYVRLVEGSVCKPKADCAQDDMGRR